MVLNVVKRCLSSKKQMTVNYLDKNFLNSNNNNSLIHPNQNDIFGDTNSFTAYDCAYNKEMRARLRSIMIFSILFTIFFFSPLALSGFYFSLKAKKEINTENYPEANKFLTKAEYANLIALIFGVISYLTLILIFSLMFYSCFTDK